VRILVLHGPNLNLLGMREPEVYGRTTLAEIDASLASLAVELGVELEAFQSNHEGALVDRIQAARAQGILINPGGYTHTSVAIRDALTAVGIPFVEIHLSNIHAREPFRRTSLLSDVALAQVAGFGAQSYTVALRGLVESLRASKQAS
jgi:3-dehydroquinate dehydratase II